MPVYQKEDSHDVLNVERKLTIIEQHELRIARRTLKMNDVFANVMGGPSKAAARATIYRLTGKYPTL